MLDERLLERTVALAREFLAELPDRHVGARASQAELRAALDLPLPVSGTDAETVVDELARAVAPGLVASAGPRYFGFVIGGALPAALAADWLTSAWDQNAGIYPPAPSASVVEEVCSRWVVELLGLPEGSSVGFVTGGQMANFTGLAAARGSVLDGVGWDLEAEGLAGAPPIRLVVGEEAHVTVFAAARLLGLGSRSVVRIPVDGQGRMKAGELRRSLSGTEGPTIVCAQAGNVNTGAIDPLDEIAGIVREHDAWCHVDGAFGLWAAASPRLSGQLAGVDLADSWAVDGHKWLNVPYDCGLVIVRDPAAHRAAMAMTAEYLPQDESDQRSPEEWVPELSRRARAFPVYAAIRSLGRAGVARIIDGCSERAAQLASRLTNEPGVEVLNEVNLNQALFRFSDSDDTTDRVIERVQRDGTCWVGGTTWQGRRAMRVSIVNWATTRDDIERSAAAISEAAQAVLATAPAGS